MTVRFVATKTEQRCLICASEHRADIDSLLEVRANRGSIGGERVTLAYVMRVLNGLGIYVGNAENTVGDSVKNHLRKHCERYNQDETIEQEAANVEKQAAMLAEAEALLERDPGSVDIESGLRRIIQIGLAEVEARLARGEKSGVTLDHAMKAAQELSRRGQNEQQASMLRTLADGIGLALGAKPEAKELPPGVPEIVEASYVPIEVEPEEAFGDEVA